MEGINDIQPRRGNHVRVFVAAALLSVAYHTETRSEWIVQESLEIEDNSQRVISLATSNRWIAKFLPLVEVIHGVGHEQISEGKYYHSDTDFPIIGPVINAYKVTKYEVERAFTLEETTSWLRSKLTYALRRGSNGRREFDVSLSFGTRSILFQVFAAPFITYPLRRSLRTNLNQFGEEINQLDSGRRASGDNKSKTATRDTMYV